jgi:colanic acid/amylovoran biosynthesis glycosyltransferase
VKLAYILSTFPCRSEVFAAREVAELHRQGFTIVVLAATKDDTSPLAAPSVPVTYGPPPFSRAALQGVWHVLTRHPVGVLRLLWLLVALCRECPREAIAAAGHFHTICAFARSFDRAELHHLHAYFLSWPACIGLAVAAVTGASLSMAAHARDVFVESGALRLKAARAKCIVACSGQTMNYLRRRLPPRWHQKLCLCHHGVVIPRGPRRVPAPDATAGRKESTLVCVGRLVPKKGHTGLVQAFTLVAARLPYCRLVIVGSGPEQEHLRQLAQQAGLTGRVEWRGWQTAEATKHVIETADVLVVPSVVGPDGDRDGIPNVILEAFVARTPVIATRLEGISEAVIDRYNGILVEPGDILGMASAIEEVLVQAHLRQSLSGAGYRTAVEKFDLHRNVRQLARLFRQRWATT